MLAGLATAELTWICDPDGAALGAARRIAPAARATAHFSDVLAASDVDAIIIATTARTHAALAIEAVRSGRHVLVEKPLALTYEDAVATVAAADAAGVVAMVGHLMAHHPAVQALARLVSAGELGDLYYLVGCRANLGRARTDENALWSLGPHDLSILDLLVKRAPISVTARGESYLRSGIADVVFLNLAYGGEPPLMAHLQLSWLSPRKERRLVVVGSRKMAELDDTSDEPLRLYDRGFDGAGADLTARNGEVSVVPVERAEPLAVELQHFIDCIVHRRRPTTDLASGLRILGWLASAQRSLDQRDG